MLDRAHLTILLASLLAAASATAACTKTEGQSSGTAATNSTATSMPSGMASAMPSASGMAMGSASATPEATAMASASGTPAPSAGPSGVTAKNGPAASASAEAAPACGTKPLPDCPLQAWMKANTNPAIASGDLPALATALDKAASCGPAGYGNWATIAKDGAKAAKGGDMTAAKASCRTCHDQYKEKYKKEMRARKI